MQREVLPQAGSQSRACQVRTVSWLPAHSKCALHTQVHSAEKLQRPGPAGTREPGRRQLGIEDVLCWRAQAHEWASCTYLQACESRGGVGVFQCWSIGCVHAHVPCKAHGMRVAWVIGTLHCLQSLKPAFLRGGTNHQPEIPLAFGDRGEGEMRLVPSRQVLAGRQSRRH